MALYHKWDVKNGFAYVLQFLSLISDGLGGVETNLEHAVGPLLVLLLALRGLQILVLRVMLV